MRHDLVKHAVAGLSAATFGWVVWLACWLSGVVGGMDGAPVLAATSAFVAGLTKEASDKLSNTAAGFKLHDVSWLDLLATFAPGLVLAAVLRHATL